MSRAFALEHPGERALGALDRLGDRHDVVADAERLGAGGGVGERLVRGEAIRQHDRVDAFGAERVDGDCRAEGRVDPAGEAEHHPRKPIVLDIVAQAEHTGRIVGLVALLDNFKRALDAAPTLIGPLPDSARHHGAKGWQLNGEAAIGVERERGSLEHDLVLPAEHVEIDERQAALDHPRHGHVLANRKLVALIGRGVADEQDLAAGLEDAFDWVGAPDVLANRHANADAAKDDRPRRRAGREHPLLVEYAVVRQVDLEPHRLDPALVQQRHRIVQLAGLDPRQAGEDRRTPVRRLARQLLAGGPAGLLEGGLQHQVLGRITGEEELRRHHEIGPEGRRLRARLAQAIAVACDVSDDESDLCERDDEAVCGFEH